jgi:ribosome biogenesis GTPase A
LAQCKKIKNEKYQTAGQWFLIAGMPNCGKSNIINGLRISSKHFNSNHVSKSSDKACLTTYSTGFKVSQYPLCFMYDTPGILLPSIESYSTAYSLGLIGSIKNTIIGKEQLVEYLFDQIGSQGLQRLKSKYKLQVIPKSSTQLTLMMQDIYKIEESEMVYDKILMDFRNGNLGKYTLDDISSHVF